MLTRIQLQMFRSKKALCPFAIRSRVLFDAIGNGKRTDSSNFLPEFSVRADFMGTDERNTMYRHYREVELF